MNAKGISVWRWCKEHWSRDPSPEVLTSLIGDLRSGRIEVPDDVLRHLPEARFPNNDPGYVYVIEEKLVGDRTQWVKIGSTKDPKSRLRELNRYEERGLLSEFHLIAFIKHGDIRKIEWYFHKISDKLGLAIPGELHDVPAAVAGDLLRAMAEWMTYSFEPRPLAECPSLRFSRRVPWNAADRQP